MFGIVDVKYVCLVEGEVEEFCEECFLEDYCSLDVVDEDIWFFEFFWVFNVYVVGDYVRLVEVVDYLGGVVYGKDYCCLVGCVVEGVEFVGVCGGYYFCCFVEVFYFGQGQEWNDNEGQQYEEGLDNVSLYYGKEVICDNVCSQDDNGYYDFSVYVYVKVFCKGFFVGCGLCSYVGGYEDDND